MASVLTSKRRRLTRCATKIIKAMAAAWRWRTGAWSSNGMIGLSIHTGMLEMELKRLAISHDKIPAGTIQVPRLSEATPSVGGLSASGGLAGFTVDLDDLRQGPTDANVHP